MRTHIPNLLLPGLALALAVGLGAAPPVRAALPAPEWRALRAQQPMRASQAETFLRSQGSALGLGLGLADGVKAVRTLTGADGHALVRLQQTHLGARVFGADLVVQVRRDGGTRLLAKSLAQGVQLSGQPTLNAERAIRVAHREVAPLGAYAVEPSAELIVFPTRHAGGLRATYDPAKGMAWDREASVLAPRPAAPYVWAYEVISVLRNEQDGVRTLHVVVDAGTGDVLRKWDATPGFIRKRNPSFRPKAYGTFSRLNAPLQVEPSRPALRAPRTASSASHFSAPEMGIGRGLYNQNVALASTPNPDFGGYDLVDPTRASNPHYWWDESFFTGNVTAYFDFSQYALVPYSMDNGAGSTSNYWGDGLPYFAPPPFVDEMGMMFAPFEGYHYADANGQTAAVDAHFASTQTYDMYKNVLGRLGIDGQDTGIMSVVHYKYMYDNAMWDSWDGVMIYGDGTWPLVPNGDRSLTALDVGAHEMSHGVMNATANLDYALEPGGLNESNSDIFGEAVVAYSKRASGDPADRIPEVALDWVLGAEINPEAGPLRFFKKPSLDGASQDAWFYGMSMLDVHYTSGPGNRMFYYLCKGAPTDSTAVAYSPYLPQGMTGIGMDAALRIWYKALTEQFTFSTDYAGAREGVLAAATELYGAGSAAVAAVENAFGAINVGPASGHPARPKVTFPADLIASDTPLGDPYNYAGAYLKTPIIPAGETARLTALVANASNPAITWKAGIGPNFYAPNASGDPLDVTAASGSFDADGLYHAPRNAPVWCGVRAFSVQDPLEWAASMVFIANLDADGDTEVDAVDAATLALTWSLPAAAVEAIATLPDPETHGFVDDYSLQMWGEGFKNAFGK